MLMALNNIASADSKHSKKTMEALKKLLDYGATHQDSEIRYYSREMISHVHSDASFLSALKGRSTELSFYFLLVNLIQLNQENLHKILRHVVDSVLESEMFTA